jgi:hypothetical protein
MTEIVTGEMTWKPPGTTECVLHLRLNSADPWRHYREFPEYAVPDPPDFSEGFATFMALLKQKWSVIK